MEGVEKTDTGSGESVMDLGYTIAYPYALRAAILLNVPKIIQSAGPGAALSASEICSHFANPEQAGATNLGTVLEILSCHGILKRSTVDVTDSTTRVKKYALTSLAQNLTRDDSTNFVQFVMAPEIIQMWPNIHETVLNPDVRVFEKFYGKGFYQYLREDAPELAQHHVTMMEKKSATQAKPLLDLCDNEFRNLTGTVVDVGGSQGLVAAAIASKYPNIQNVVNFDLSDVVSGAPAMRGVEHVGGSFLDFVPQGDLMIMKFVLLNWSDEDVVKLLLNCCNALPAKGKVIIADRVTADVESEENSDRLRIAFVDLLNCLSFGGGKTRTLKQLRSLAEAAGFAAVRLVKKVDFMTIVVAEKA